jgi:hypothetical protein
MKETSVDSHSSPQQQHILDDLLDRLPAWLQIAILTLVLILSASTLPGLQS